VADDFYNAFDRETLHPVVRGGEADLRTPFMLDRDRILYSSAFRRLQAKTQVFLSGEYDFYRTRLTHSLEVAQIGRSICHVLAKSGDCRVELDPDLVEGICLAHDIGHPPFGHAGERALHDLMREQFGGFEGNAQTLRILTRTIYKRSDGRLGMNPTRALLDGVMKYKALHREVVDAEHHFLYDEDAEIVRFVCGGEAGFAELPVGAGRNGHRSIECRVMDWADDTAYSLNDMLDGIHAGLIRPETVEKWAEGQRMREGEEERVKWLVETMRAGKAEARFSRKIGEYVAAVRLVEQEHPLGVWSARHRYTLEVPEKFLEESGWFKRLARDVVFRSPPLQQLEFKGRRVLEGLFEALMDNYSGRRRALRLVPQEVDQAVAAAGGDRARARLLCDYLAGMTDSFAVRVYRRLLDPSYNVIADL